MSRNPQRPKDISGRDNRSDDGGADMPASRRFPPPWTVEELDACFVVKDSGGQKLGYFYYEEEPGRRKHHDTLPTLVLTIEKFDSSGIA